MLNDSFGCIHLQPCIDTPGFKPFTFLFIYILLAYELLFARNTFSIWEAMKYFLYYLYKYSLHVVFSHYLKTLKPQPVMGAGRRKSVFEYKSIVMKKITIEFKHGHVGYLE